MPIWSGEPDEALDFPSEEKMGEGTLHWRLRFLLFGLLEPRLRGRALVGCDQFMYWDGEHPTSCLAPDAYVKFGGPHPLALSSYKIWEHGSPELGVEIIDRTTRRWTNLEDKLERYRRARIGEIVFFDSNGHDPLLRIWDWVEGDVVPRDLNRPDARYCRALDAYWVVVADPELGPVLRVSDDAEGRKLWPTQAETERAEKEAERAAKETERAEKERALARVAELEAELARRR